MVTDLRRSLRRQERANVFLMADQRAVCGTAPAEPLARVNLPSELFKPLRFLLISLIYEFGSVRITHRLVSPLSPSRRGGGEWRGGGGAAAAAVS